MKKDFDLPLKFETSLQNYDSTQKNRFNVVEFYKWANQRQVNSIKKNKYTGGLIMRSTWSIEHGTYNKMNGAFFFGILQRAQIQRLGLTQNKRPNIIREIKQVSFPILTKLLLSGNHITSLQFLDHLDAPLLESIALMNNNLTHIRSIKKCNFSFLTYFGIQKNFINQFSTMTKTLTKNFCQCFLEMSQNQYVEGHNLNWLIKIDAQNLEQLWIQSSKRINLKKIKNQLLRKFPQIVIEDFERIYQI